MRAFGGGSHLCPGRKFIANEVKALIATLATSCEIDLVDPNQKVEFDMWRQGAGIPQPRESVMAKIRSK
jgi:cytochrome P450